MIEAISYTGYTDLEVIKKRAGLALVNIALVDPDFEARWRQEACTENQGLTQIDILNKMREYVGIEFRAYRKWWSKVIGYFISGDILWDNLKYLDEFSPVLSGSNDGHEFLHMLGFTHDFTLATSTNYTFNRVFESWGAEYLKANTDQPAPAAAGGVA